MSSIYAKLGLKEPGHLPPSPEVAIVMGSLFQRLGGWLYIDSNGERRMSVPMAGAYEGEEWDKYPHPVPNAEPTERFMCGDQYEGAMRMVLALLRRLHPTDKTLIYDAFADVPIRSVERGAQ
ncbi:MAG: hypothetical protein AAGI28_03555 [Pseudomonadota bacterium]